MRSPTAFILLALLTAGSSASMARAQAPMESAAERFFASVAGLCGKAFAGMIVANQPPLRRPLITSECRPDHNFRKQANASATPSINPSAIGPAASTVANNIGSSGTTISEAKSLKKLTNPRKTTVLGNFLEATGFEGFG